MQVPCGIELRLEDALRSSGIERGRDAVIERSGSMKYRFERSVARDRCEQRGDLSAVSAVAGHDGDRLSAGRAQ
jgi:hypothetical protein